MNILVINGPNINTLGKREKEHYGDFTYDELLEYLKNIGEKTHINIECYQSNIEGEIINQIQKSDKYDALIINPAGYSHTSVAILDALLVINIPIVEVHISNIQKRDDFRHKSITAKAAKGIISGLGKEGYYHAVMYLKNLHDSKEQRLNNILPNS